MNFTDILTRLILTFGIILTGLGVYILYNWMLSRRATESLLADFGIRHPGNFLIVYFSSPTCAPCKTIQRPALDNVLDIMGGS